MRQLDIYINIRYGYMPSFTQKLPSSALPAAAGVDDADSKTS